MAAFQLIYSGPPVVTGYTGSSHLSVEIEKVSAKMGINTLGDFGTRIKDAQQVFLKNLWHLRAPRLYIRWLALLFARQLVVRVLVKVTMSELRPDPKFVPKEAVKAAFAATEESVHDLFPKGLAEEMTKSLGKVITKVVSEIVAGMAVE